MDETVSKKLNDSKFYDVIIVGGGLAGLISSILLAKNCFKTLLLEKKSYPFHKVCGEYVSNEVLDFLNTLGFDPFLFNASRISRLRISNPSGKNILANLDLGGFGLSRFIFDQALISIAKKAGVSVLENCRINDIIFHDDLFSVSSAAEIFHSHLVLGTYGKRDILDKKLNRQFIRKHTGYLGVKYHIKLDYPINEIGLDNFPGGYSGIVKIEDDKYNLCYLYRRKEADVFKSIPELEEKILFTNPVIRDIFQRAAFISESPEVINEIFFENKSCIENHILLCGDAAGLITPLCGNGMAMAIHGAKILSDILIGNFLPGENIKIAKRIEVENKYNEMWKRSFSNRLFWGRNLQKVSGNTTLTSAALKMIHSIPAFEKWIISKTHGKQIN